MMKKNKISIYLMSALLATSLLASCKPADSIESIPSTEQIDQTSEAESNQQTETDQPAETLEETTDENALQITNLADEESYSFFRELLEQSSVPEERIQVLFDHIDQFADHVGKDKLLSGYTSVGASELKFDEYELQDLWFEKEPEFTGYNCRITAYTLMGDRIEIGDTSSPDSRNSYLDLDSLSLDNSALFGEDTSKFEALFTTVEGENSADQAAQIQKVKDEMARRNISFEKAGNLSLVELYLHTHYADNDNELFVGHTGVLLDMAEEGLYFFEKLAFQAPYRLVRLKDREELKNYLLTHYASFHNEGEAEPFILENGQEM